VSEVILLLPQTFTAKIAKECVVTRVFWHFLKNIKCLLQNFLIFSGFYEKLTCGLMRTLKIGFLNTRKYTNIDNILTVSHSNICVQKTYNP
jgi:hypothetical protein